MQRSLALAALALFGACAGGSEPTPVAPAAHATPTDAMVAVAPGTRSDVEIAEFAARHAAGARVIDVRTAEEYAAGHVPGAVLVPSDLIDPTAAPLAEYPKDEPLYVICQSGRRSSIAADTLAAAGFTAVNVKGGTAGWIADGHPVEP